MSLEFRIRPAHNGDVPFLEAMLYEAAFWRSDATRPPEADMRANDHIMRYLSEWGRPDDAGVIAEDGRGRPIGAAWSRVFSKEHPGYGFIDESTPEITIAVREDCRGMGVGTALLSELIRRAASAGFPALSLSVAAENPALRLYERTGFVKMELIQGSWTMECRLQAQR